MTEGFSKLVLPDKRSLMVRIQTHIQFCTLCSFQVKHQLAILYESGAHTRKIKHTLDLHRYKTNFYWSQYSVQSMQRVEYRDNFEEIPGGGPHKKIL